jgi:hypothetical protein
MEQCVVVLPVSPFLNLRIYAQVHIPVYGGIVVPYRYALACGEELCEIAWCCGNGFALQRHVIALRDLVRGHIVEVVVVEFFFAGRSISVNGGAGRVCLIFVVEMSGCEVVWIASLYMALVACLCLDQRRTPVTVLSRICLVRAVAVAAAGVSTVTRLISRPMYVSGHVWFVIMMILNEVKFEGAKTLLRACHVSRSIYEVETRRVKQVQRSETAHERVTWHEALVRPDGINRICRLLTGTQCE